MPAHVSHCPPFQTLDVQATPMLVPGQKLVSPGLGKMISLIDGHPDVGVSSPETIGGTRPRAVPRQVDVVMEMIGMLVQALVHEGVLRGPAPRFPVMSPRDDVPEMPDHGVDEKEPRARPSRTPMD